MTDPGSVVDVGAMGHRQSDDDEPRILDLRDQPIVADSVAPVARQVAGESLAASSRVITGADLLEIADDATLDGLVEIGERLVECRGRLDVPHGQRFSSAFSSLRGREDLPLAS